MQGTGCYDDKETVQRALQDAKGNTDEVRRYPAKNALQMRAWTLCLQLKWSGVCQEPLSCMEYHVDEAACDRRSACRRLSSWSREWQYSP